MATVRLLTAVPTSGTSSQLHALAVKSHTLMFPCWSPAVLSTVSSKALDCVSHEQKPTNTAATSLAWTCLKLAALCRL